MWMEYLHWYRRTLALLVENGVEVTASAPEGTEFRRLHLTGAQTGTILARRVVMAAGRDGTGGPNIPDFVAPLRRRIENMFGRLKDWRRIAARAVVMEAARLAGETGTVAGVRADEELLAQLAEQGVTITDGRPRGLRRAGGRPARRAGRTSGRIGGAGGDPRDELHPEGWEPCGFRVGSTP